jgi:hypothetical protein
VNDTNYIEQVRSVLNSSDNDVDKVQKIYALIPPENSTPLVVLIHGDSQQLEDNTKYARNDDPANPSDKEINELQKRLAMQIVEKVGKYLADWDAENVYNYSFSLKATYGAYKNDQGEVEYVDVIKSDNALKTIPEAVQAARQWQNRLLERITLYTEQEVGHKQISVKPIYTIRDAKRNHIASGTLEFDDERGVSTWLNQA